MSTNSGKIKTTTCGTCRHQIAKMVSRSLFLFPVYKRHFVFITVTIIYLCRTYVLWIGLPRKCRYSRWNFSNMLFLSEAISISGLQAPFCFFPVIIIYLRRAVASIQVRSWGQDPTNFLPCLGPHIGPRLNFHKI